MRQNGRRMLALLAAGWMVCTAAAAMNPVWGQEAVPGENAAEQEMDSWEIEEAETQTTPEQVEMEEETARSGESTQDDTVQVHRIHYAADEEEIWKALRDFGRRWRYDSEDELEVLDGDLMYEAREESAAMSTGAVPDSIANMDTGVSASAAVPDYSDTNVRTQGVDEADIIKTDGRYLYILHDRKELLIVEAAGKDTRLLSRTVIESGTEEEAPIWNTGAKELFAADGRVYVITMEYNDRYDTAVKTHPYYYSDTIEYKTCLYVYDLADPLQPVLETKLELDGCYEQARRKDGTIYLFSRWDPLVEDTTQESTLLPQIGEEQVRPEEVILPDYITSSTCLLMASVSMEDPQQWTDRQVLVSGAEQLYVSSENIYAVNVNNWSSTDRSEITKIRYSEGGFTGIAAGTVHGQIDDTFSIDEYDGNLRVLTSYWGKINKSLYEIVSDLLGLDYYDEDQWERHNALYVLDENLRRIGRIADLAKGEEIKSARFFGDTAYFVTFRRTDPLFTADLSDPHAPVIIGELTLPGFSAYLHPFGEGRILGMGYDADEETGAVTGLKLSLFDTSDPANVKEIARRIVPGITWCPAVDEYKAVFADITRQLIGFWCSDRYLVYTPDGGEGFDKVLLYDFFEDDLLSQGDYSSIRGLYIGDEFYLAGPSFVIAFDMRDGFRKDCVLRL